ncbi:NADH-quinone oxidoreductase subunit A [uncultured Mucilaginibacter sp.]|uniref:NADH-quinone oxidoreductase subunit A n=1 Tax=uncultured Mucilaginibacter sp. TaxID=797541 RepID=UPI0025FE03B7|nr:NADH-quinone oxidoreductase subunit A [uncultured Mucilaginibacter sp.]
MGDVVQISEFGKIILFLIIGIIMMAVAFFVNHMLAPNNPTPEKLTSYECGEEPEGNAWLQFNAKFYVIALIFLLFDVEMVFIFPWATVFGSHQLIAADARWGWFSLTEMFVFVGILILGLAYVWVKGDLNWVRPHPIKPIVDTKIPVDLYKKINFEQSGYRVIAFTMETAKPEPVAAATETATAPATATKRPMFKPTFKKPTNES